MRRTYRAVNWTILIGVLIIGVMTAMRGSAKTVNWTLPGHALVVSNPCAKSVSIMPGDPGGTIAVTATGHHGEIMALQMTSGNVAGITGTGCHAGPLERRTLALTIHLPPGAALTIDEAGDTNYTVGTLNAPLSLQLDGSGDVTAGAVTDLNANLTGSGDANIGSVDGVLRGALSGSGDLNLQTIAAASTSLTLSGSGDVDLGSGDAGMVTATLDASGDLTAPAATGMKLMMGGDGDVTGGAVNGPLQASLTGSGDLKLDGVTGDAALTISGSGDVTIPRVAGHLTKDVSGSGDVQIGGS